MEGDEEGDDEEEEEEEDDPPLSGSFLSAPPEATWLAVGCASPGSFSGLCSTSLMGL